MLLGFISLLLTVGEGLISKICISEKVAATWHPCSNNAAKEEDFDDESGGHRRLLADHRRILAGGGIDKCAENGKVAFVSAGGIHQLHIFIFVLAVFHVLYCILTLALGRAKVKIEGINYTIVFFFFISLWLHNLINYDIIDEKMEKMGRGNKDT